MKRKLFVIMAVIAVLGLTACGNREEDIRPIEIPQEEFEDPTPTPAVVTLGDVVVECKTLEAAEVGDVVLFGKNELAWWVVEKGEDHVYLLSAYIVDYSDYVEEYVSQTPSGFYWSYRYKILKNFLDREYREKFFSYNDLSKLLPTGDKFDEADLYMTMPNVEEMIQWFPDLLTEKYIQVDNVYGRNFLELKEGAEASDIRLNPPIAPMVEVDEENVGESDRYSWWMLDMIGSNDSLFVPYWREGRCEVLSREPERLCELYYKGVRPVIKVKVDRNIIN